MNNPEYTDRSVDVTISNAYRGDIACANLTVTAEGSIVGNVEAANVRNHGRIHGVVNADETFLNMPGARFRGSVYAEGIGNHPSAKFEATTSHTERFTPGGPAIVPPSAIDIAVREGILRELAKLKIGSVDHQGFVHAPAAVAAEAPVPEAPAPADDHAEMARELETAVVADLAVGGDVGLQAADSADDWREEPVIEFVWAPPGRGRMVRVDDEGRTVPNRRALPPLFAN